MSKETEVEQIEDTSKWHIDDFITGHALIYGIGLLHFLGLYFLL